MGILNLEAGSELTIRPIDSNDVEHLEALDKICFSNAVRFNRHALSHYLSLPNSIGLLQSNDNMLQGFIITTMAAEEIANIVTIDVEPTVRNRGIGSNLVFAVKNILKDRQVKRITLQVSTDNTTAINFYIKHGFKITKSLPNYYPNTDGYQMEYKME